MTPQDDARDRPRLLLWLAVGSLLAAAGLWVWALAAPEDSVGPVPERFVGEFVLWRYEPPLNKDGNSVMMRSPYAPGQERRWHIRADGTYMMRVLVSGGYEMMRQEGVVWVDGEHSMMTMKQLSENRADSEPIDYAYSVQFSNGPQGDELKLTAAVTDEEREHLSRGHELYLRKVGG
ncbi:MAG: hypothetical protein ACYTGN_14140 [Planctomycetota bacterium]|jgi:hypothetical protein